MCVYICYVPYSECAFIDKYVYLALYNFIYTIEFQK